MNTARADRRVAASLDKASPAQIGAIHALAKKAGMDEDTRRDFLERETGLRSCAALSRSQAIAVIDGLRKIVDGAPAGKAKGAVAGLDTPVARKLRALWIAAYDLGLVRERSDRAMLSFLERQTGVSHTRFLSSPGEGAPAIEALKSWLARDGGVEWPAREAWKKDGKADFDEIAASKWAIIEAQWRRLTSLSHHLTIGDAWLANHAEVIAAKSLKRFELSDFDAVQKELGRVLRAALARVVVTRALGGESR